MPPQNPSYPGAPGGDPAYSYQGGDGSGMVPVSGSPYDPTLSGPWMIETQGLTITYHRVPRMYGVSSVNHGLASVSRGDYIQNTEMLQTIAAYYKREKVYANYSTSTWQQPQTFRYLINMCDPYGNCYGASSDYVSSGGGTSALGPQGQAITAHKWYNRRPWDELGDSTKTEGAYGTKHCFQKGYTAGSWGGGAGCGGWQEYQDGTSYYGDYSRAPSPLPLEPNTYLQGQEFYRRGYPSYSLPGNYSPQQESNQQIKGYIDLIGNDVMNERLFGVGNKFDVECDSFGIECWPVFTEGCPSYRISRHDWT